MPCKITWEPRGAYAKFWGECSIRDLLQMFGELSSHSETDRLRFVLVDYLDVTFADVTKHEIEEAAAHDIGMTFTNPNIAFASVTTDPRIRSLWNHFLSVNVSPERHQLFDSLAAARAWLDTKKV